MPDPEILVVLERLAQAYPEKRLDKHTLKVYLEELSDVPVGLLHQAASQHIRTSNYFPRVAELRRLAQQLSGTTNFASLATPACDHLDLQAFKLYTDFFKLGNFNPQDWLKLITQFENLGRSCRAEELHQQFTHLQQVQAAHLRGEEWPPASQRRRYREWSTLGTQPATSEPSVQQDDSA